MIKKGIQDVKRKKSNKILKNDIKEWERQKNKMTTEVNEYKQEKWINSTERVRL